MKSLILTGANATWSEFNTARDFLLAYDWTVDIATRGKETVWGEMKGPAGLVNAGAIVPTRDVPMICGETVVGGSFPKPSAADGYDLLVLPGGAKAMEYLRQDRDVIDFIAAFHASGGVIASICHAAQLLISAKLVKGRRIAGYYSLRDDIENAGGTYCDTIFADDRIVSASHYKHNGAWMKLTLETVGKA